MKKHDWFALFLSIITFFAAAYISRNIYEDIPHIEDEITYVWQARLAAAGKLTIESPVCPSCFLQPFVVDLDGMRFGKYPPGWPAVLSLGVRLGIRNLVNPLLAALFVWLNYLLVRKILNPSVALIATVLTVLSPFFLLNAGTLLAHIWALLLAVIFAHAWLDTLNPAPGVPRWMITSAAVLSMGLIILTRPLTAVGICIPFAVHGLLILFMGTPGQKRRILVVGTGIALFAPVYLLWQYHLTGDFFLNPYVLYWPYDKIGFGPDVGLHPDGHQLKYAWVNTKFSMQIGLSDFFGWPLLSWLFMPFGLLAIRKNRQALLISSVFFSLVIAYGLYWIGSWLFGPRYYFEGFFSLTLLSSAGICWLAGKVTAADRKRWFQRARFVFTFALMALLMLGNVCYYLPMRLTQMKGLYGIESVQLTPFKTEEALRTTPALVIVKPQDYWLEYGTLLDISSPTLDSPFIFTYDRGEEHNRQVIEAYPDRTVVYYDPGRPWTFFIPAKK